VIDRLREQIQQRLEQLGGEADRLRKALAALDPRSSSAPAPTAATRTAPARKRAQATAPKTAAPATKTAAPATKTAAPATKSAPTQRTSQSTAATGRRTAPGATKASVLAALAGGEAMTAGEVAGKTGLARATVSTTLSNLAKSGQVQKAQRGYRVASTAGE
jgi:DNA-binding transcriptional ArsR family regulator